MTAKAQTELEALRQVAEERAAKREPHKFNGATSKTLQDILDASPSIAEWLKWYALNTQESYAATILQVCVDNNIAPSAFLKLAPNKARDMCWSWIEKNCLETEQTSKGVIAQAALTSFYRSETVLSCRGRRNTAYTSHSKGSA